MGLFFMKICEKNHNQIAFHFQSKCPLCEIIKQNIEINNFIENFGLADELEKHQKNLRFIEWFEKLKDQAQKRGHRNLVNDFERDNWRSYFDDRFTINDAIHDQIYNQ